MTYVNHMSKLGLLVFCYDDISDEISDDWQDKSSDIASHTLYVQANKIRAEGTIYRYAKMKRPRPDLEHSFWSSLHILLRKAPEGLVSEIEKAARTQTGTNNIHLTIAANAATHIYRDLENCYRQTTKTENNYKKRVQAQIEPKHPKNERRRDEIIRQEVNTRWKRRSKYTLDHDKTYMHMLQQIDKILQHYAPYDDSDILDTQHGAMKEYKALFPGVSEAELADDILLGRWAAVNEFVARYGFFSLWGDRLKKNIEPVFSPGIDAADTLEIAFDKISGPPYNVPFGIKENNLRTHLAGQSRALKILDMAEQLIEPARSPTKVGQEESPFEERVSPVPPSKIQWAILTLKDVGLDEPVEIITTQDFAILLLALGRNQNRSDFTKLAEQINAVTTVKSLQTLMESGTTQQILSNLDHIDGTQNETINNAVSMLKSALQRVDEFKIEEEPSRRVKASERTAQSAQAAYRG